VSVVESGAGRSRPSATRSTAPPWRPRGS